MLPGPIDAAWRRLKEADRKFELPRLEALAAQADASQELAAERREAWGKYLAETPVKNYCEFVKLVTGRQDSDYALSRWKRFWSAKAKREGKSETWVEGKLVTYRSKKKFTLAEAKQLQEELNQLSGYRGQGKVLKPSDGRLKVNRKKKLAKLQKAQEPKRPRGRPQTSVKTVYVKDIEAVESITAAAATGKTRTLAPAY
jgi:hypothetical protein